LKILRAVLLSAVLLASITSVAACSRTTKIGDVLTSSSKYQGKDIAIKGTVGETVWLAAAGRGTYQLGDGSGNIWVITTQPPPQKGQSISTEGTVEPGFSLLGRSYGTVIVETKRE
jgi:hypothetical protein